MAQQGIDIAAVQRGLLVLSPVSPGRADGVWGARTRASLEAYFRDRWAPGQAAARIASLDVILARATRINLDSMDAGELYHASQESPGLRRSVCAYVCDTTRPQRTATAGLGIIETRTTQIVVGIGVAALLIGGGYWLYTRSRRGRRR